MRVLDPGVTNPVYRLHHKATQKAGDAGTLAAVTGLGIMVPMGAGVMVDTMFALISAIGWYGLITFRGYKSNTKAKTRITAMMVLRNSIPADYHDVIDPMIKEVYDCNRNHYDFRKGDQGIQYVTAVRSNGISTEPKRLRETDAEWKKRREEEKILEAGYGCRYCGDRIMAARLLKEQCDAADTEDNSSVSNALAVVEAKKETNRAFKEFQSPYTNAQRELS